MRNVLFAASVGAVLGLSALARGGSPTWAFVPLIGAAAVIGAAGLRRSPAIPPAVTMTLLLVAAALTLQLIPLSWDPLESTCRHASLSIL